jgi:hypothetical protein
MNKKLKKEELYGLDFCSFFKENNIRLYIKNPAV